MEGAGLSGLRGSLVARWIKPNRKKHGSSFYNKQNTHDIALELTKDTNEEDRFYLDAGIPQQLSVGGNDVGFDFRFFKF